MHVLDDVSQNLNYELPEVLQNKRHPDSDFITSVFRKIVGIPTVINIHDSRYYSSEKVNLAYIHK